MGAIIKTLMTKDDLAKFKADISRELGGLGGVFGDIRGEVGALRQQIRKSKNDIIKLMFVLAVAQVIAQWLMFYFFVR